MSYSFGEIESKWQQYWEQHRTFATPENTDKPKYYVLDMFPYPSGNGLHVGHPLGYTATDIVARYRRMKGFNVLHPMGFDAFGLPTERYSMKTGIHPAVATADNVANFRRQLKALGFSYDWEREINTTLPDYYRWTQWIFLLIYNSWYDAAQQRARPIAELPIPEHLTNPLDIQAYQDERRLAYIANIPVNWCEELGTVLANEEVEEWRQKGHTVERRPMRQWMLRITEYAPRLLDDLELVHWPDSTKDMQKYWIGRSVGAEIHFGVAGSEHTVTVFTTRPDTLFGATYVVLAPEHPLVDALTADHARAEVDAYRAAAALKSDLERTELAKDKSGVATGGAVLHPITGRILPVWVGDYVLAHYGTGAVMAVPGHDERDHEFARKYGLPIEQVVNPAEGPDTGVEDAAFTEPGIAVNSHHGDFSIDGLPTARAKQAVIDHLAAAGRGRGVVRYKLRDWLFSRQRYWGEPIPILYFDDGTRRALDPEELPLTLPEVEEYRPAGTGESPLATVPSWVDFTDAKTGKHARLETNTMPQWAGSCWYYLRFIDPANANAPVDPDKERYWMGADGVDLYVGGAEHAVLHLLYARFWHKVLYDYGYVSSKEPFHTLFHQGLILGEDQRKMSKSLGNVVNPDDIIASYGADALRLFEMFMGPLELSKPWSTKGVEGTHRFLARAWRLIATDEGTLSPAVVDEALTDEQEHLLATLVKKVGDDIEGLRFNTAVSQMMIFVNEFTKLERRPRAALSDFVRCLAPFAPHIAEELWHILGNTASVALAEFPSYNPAALERNTVTVAVQVNGKVRGKLEIPVGLTQEQAEAAARADANVSRHLGESAPKKVVYVQNRILNFIL